MKPAATSVDEAFRAILALLKRAADEGRRRELIELDDKWDLVLPPDWQGDLAGYELHLDVGSVEEIIDTGQLAPVEDDGAFELRSTRATYRFGLLAWALEQVRRRSEDPDDQWRSVAQHFAARYRELGEVVYVAGRALELAQQRDNVFFWWQVMAMGDQTHGSVQNFAPALLRAFVSVSELRLPPDPEAGPALPPAPWLQDNELLLDSALKDAPSLDRDADPASQESRRAQLRSAINVAVEQVDENRRNQIRQAQIDQRRIDVFVDAVAESFDVQLRLAVLVDQLTGHDAEPDDFSERLDVKARMDKTTFLELRPTEFARAQGENAGRALAEAENRKVISALDEVPLKRGDEPLPERLRTAVNQLRKDGFNPNVILTPSARYLESLLIDPRSTEEHHKRVQDLTTDQQWISIYLGDASGVPTFRLRHSNHLFVVDLERLFRRGPPPAGNELDTTVTAFSPKEAVDAVLEGSEGPSEEDIEEQAATLMERALADLSLPFRLEVADHRAGRRVSVPKSLLYGPR